MKTPAKGIEKARLHFPMINASLISFIKVWPEREKYPHGSYNQFEFVSRMAASGVMLVIELQKWTERCPEKSYPCTFQVDNCSSCLGALDWIGGRA